MNPWLIFLIGLILGQFSMLCLIGLFQCSGSDPEPKGVEADCARDMLGGGNRHLTK